jgi:nitrite reductase (NADH) large subunit
MARHVADYRCEWKEAIESPEVLARFKTFVNTDEPDPSVVFVRERGQIRPARAEEKAGR